MDSPNQDLKDKKEPVELNAFGKPVGEDEFELSDFDTDTDSSDEEFGPNPINQNGIADPNYHFVNEILNAIRRLTPAIREMARAHLRILVQRYIRPEWNIGLARQAPPVPRHNPRG